jgi:hypothetical protein
VTELCPNNVTIDFDTASIIRKSLSASQEQMHQLRLDNDERVNWSSTRWTVGCIYEIYENDRGHQSSIFSEVNTGIVRLGSVY